MKTFRNNIFKTGFTLAEVLITLGIIGVVAGMTIPTLINNYQKIQTETQLKKAYSVLTQFFRQYLADEGCEDLMCTGIFDITKTDSQYQDDITELIPKYIKIIKSCKNGDVSCRYNAKSIKGNTTVTEFDTGGKTAAFITQDGVEFGVSNSGCTPTDYPEVSRIKNRCSWIVVDLNGPKSPNVLGKDVFGFGNVAQDGMIYPDTSVEWAKAKSGTLWESNGDYWKNNDKQCGAVEKTIAETPETWIQGQNCLARIIENSWEIDYY